jgi:sec-independent protein translocase protein TatB
VFNIGPQELLVILLVALVIVGPQRLPELARTIGRALNELRRAQDEVTRTIRLGLDEAEPIRPSGPAAGRAAEQTPEQAPGQEGNEQRSQEAPEQENAVEVARMLGRGLAEIRRARREVQRTFRIDLTEDPAPPRRSLPGTPSGAAPPPSAGAPPPAAGTPAATDRSPEDDAAPVRPEPPEAG